MVNNHGENTRAKRCDSARVAQCGFASVRKSRAAVRVEDKIKRRCAGAPGARVTASAPLPCPRGEGHASEIGALSPRELVGESAVKRVDVDLLGGAHPTRDDARQHHPHD